MTETSPTNPAGPELVERVIQLPAESPVHDAHFALVDRLAGLADGVNALAQEARANSVAHGFGAHGARLRSKIERLQTELRESDRLQPLLTVAQKKLIEREVAEAQEDYDAYVGNRIMLIQGEGAEAHEEVRSGHELTETYYRADGKPEGVGAELADIVIRVFDTAIELGIDLETRLVEKMTYNAGRPAMHGRKF